MPAYDYRCQACGREMELIHRISESISQVAHDDPSSGTACEGTLERLIPAVGISASVGNKPPSDDKLEKLGFTKYVRGSKGYEKAFGSEKTPSFIDRE